MLWGYCMELINTQFHGCKAKGEGDLLYRNWIVRENAEVLLSHK